jgi:hypothetical protein
VSVIDTGSEIRLIECESFLNIEFNGIAYIRVWRRAQRYRILLQLIFAVSEYKLNRYVYVFPLL